MKKYIFYTVIIFLFLTNHSNNLFAQSKNEKFEALNDYFETIIKDTTKVVFVSKEKINSNETLDISRIIYEMMIEESKEGKGDLTLFKKEDIQIMNRKYRNNCVAGYHIWCQDDFWTKDNFRNKKILFESMNTKTGIEPILEKYNKADLIVYSFSEPIYYQENKRIVFTVNESYISGANTYVVIMKKSKNQKKWIIVYRGGNPNIIN